MSGTKHYRFTQFIAHSRNDDNVWGIEATPRTEVRRLFAEFLMSRSSASTIVEKSVKLPSLCVVFVAQGPENFKSSLFDLPHQYGRSDDGALQLAEDMHRNISHFGRLIDCGITRGIAGYVVLEVQCLPSPDDNLSIQHLARWVYSHSSIDATLGDVSDAPSHSIQVYATWKDTPPYCRYCHRVDHSITDYPAKVSVVPCNPGSAIGHKSSRCPSRNNHSISGVSHKRRKTPGSDEESPATAAASAASNRDQAKPIVIAV